MHIHEGGFRTRWDIDELGHMILPVTVDEHLAHWTARVDRDPLQGWLQSEA
jgi:hypothetical protein